VTVGAAVAQSVRAEVFQEADIFQAGGDEVIVIQQLGMYGAVTATFGMYKGRQVITSEGSALDTTSFGGNWDNVPTVNIVLKPNESLRCWMTDSAADPAGIVCAVKGKVYKVSELSR